MTVKQFLTKNWNLKVKAKDSVYQPPVSVNNYFFSPHECKMHQNPVTIAPKNFVRNLEMEKTFFLVFVFCF